MSKELSDADLGKLIKRRMTVDESRSDEQLGRLARLRLNGRDPRSLNDDDFEMVMLK